MRVVFCFVSDDADEVITSFLTSSVIKGIVCKKNVAHRRMSSKIDKARLLLLGGALEYQRVANHLSSFDTLLQQVVTITKLCRIKYCHYIILPLKLIFLCFVHG